MYLIDIPLLVLGIIAITKLHPRLGLVLLSWIFLSVFPAALTKNPFSSTRTLMMLPALYVLEALGVWSAYQALVTYRKKLIQLIIYATCLTYAVFTFHFIDEYFIHFPLNRSEHWGVAQEQTVLSILKLTDSSDVIITHPEEGMYSYVLFYGKYGPTAFQQQAKRYARTEDGFVYISEFGKYHFRPTLYPDDLTIPNRLIVEKTVDLPSIATDSSTLYVDEEGKERIVKSRIYTVVELPDRKPGYTIIQTYLSDDEIKDTRELHQGAL
jgi:hypothetical protein